MQNWLDDSGQVQVQLILWQLSQQSRQRPPDLLEQRKAVWPLNSVVKPEDERIDKSIEL